MVFYILAFLIGASCLILLSHLPPFWVGWVLLLNGLLWPIRLLRLLIAAVLGFAWALLSAQQLMAWTLPADLEGKKIVITGTINTIPEFKNNNLSFEFDVEKGIQPARVRLSWYHGPNQLRVGDRWQLTVRLKRPRGFWNAESFDYQAWLLEHHVRATGYVIANGDNHLISSNRFEHIINRIREHLAQKITEILSGKPLVGLVSALAVGVRDSITEEQWSVLRGTGTNHLFAIAGLHIGFVSGLIYFL